MTLVIGRAKSYSKGERERAENTMGECTVVLAILKRGNSNAHYFPWRRKLIRKLF